MSDKKRGPGRPRLDTPRRKHIALRYPIELIDRVDKAADREGVTRTGWIEDAIEKKLDESDRDDPYPIDLIDRVDKAADRESVTRYGWIENAIEKKLDEAERDDPSSES